MGATKTSMLVIEGFVPASSKSTSPLLIHGAKTMNSRMSRGITFLYRTVLLCTGGEERRRPFDRPFIPYERGCGWCHLRYYAACNLKGCYRQDPIVRARIIESCSRTHNCLGISCNPIASPSMLWLVVNTVESDISNMIQVLRFGPLAPNSNTQGYHEGRGKALTLHVRVRPKLIGRAPRVLLAIVIAVRIRGQNQLVLACIH